MWIAREAQKDRKDRRPVPKPAAAMPTGKLNLQDAASMAAYNEAATKQFNERALVPCQNCGRTFFEDRLAIHLRSCRPGNEAARVGTGRIKSASEAVAAATPQKARGPGQTYGSSSGGGGAPSINVGSTISPTAAGVLKKLSPGGVTSRPRTSGGVSFADGVGSGTPTARSRVAPVKSSGGTWEDDLNDELAAAAAPPAKSYSLPADNGGGDEYEGDLVPCSLCGRNFNADRLAKHEAVCRKQAASNAKRAKLIARKAAKLPEPGSQKSAGTEAWKSKHNEFQNAIQYAKKMAAMQKAGVSLASLPPPPRSENPDYVTCPHCDRRFNQNAASRHIPSCANTINKPKAVNRGGPVKPPAAGSMAAQRAAKAAAAARQAPSRQPAYGAPQGYSQYGDEYGSSAYGASAYGAPSYGSPTGSSSRPGTSSAPRGAAPPAAAGRVTPVSRGSAVGSRPVAQRSPSSAYGGGGGGGEDLHAKINQLTATVAKLSQAVLSPPAAAAGRAPVSRGGGAACRSCGQTNPVSGARFCPSCGARS